MFKKKKKTGAEFNSRTLVLTVQDNRLRTPATPDDNNIVINTNYRLSTIHIEEPIAAV